MATYSSRVPFQNSIEEFHVSHLIKLERLA